jgi:adenine/guanine phosphoribosyltransferase-like PRPP-binding protein
MQLLRFTGRLKVKSKLSHYAHLAKRELNVIKNEGLIQAIKKTNRYLTQEGGIKNILLKSEDGKLTFISLHDAISWIDDWCIELQPQNYDIIAGIPRGGLIIASIIATRYDKPLSTPDELLNGKAWRAETLIAKGSKVLLIDDTLSSGYTMQKTREEIRKLNYQVTTAVMVALPEMGSKADCIYKFLSRPFQCEWDLAHGKGRDSYMVASDLDGVICYDCPEEIYDLSKEYEEWLINAKLQFLPSYEIEAIVTCRLEKYRAITENWLVEHRVKYHKLYMWDTTEGERGYTDNFARHKVDMLRKIKPDIYYESSQQEAILINQATKIPVLWWKGKVLIQ